MYSGFNELGTIKIKSNSKIVLDKGSTICQSPNIEDYIVDNTFYVDACGKGNGWSLFYANGANDIEITGSIDAIIKGQGSLWKENDAGYKRPGLIRLVNCKRVKLRNLVLIDSPCWAIQIQNCEDVQIDNINIISKWGTNNCGIIIDGCRNVRISKCNMDVGDDCIVLRTTDENMCKDIVCTDCVLSSEWSAIKIGTESVGDFENVLFKDMFVKSAMGCAIKIVATDGGKINNVAIENITIKNSTGPVFIVNGTRNKTYRDGNYVSNVSSIDGIELKNINADVLVGDNKYSNKVGDCVFISGTVENKIKNLTVKDCSFNMPGGITIDEDYSVAELMDEYPEYYILGRVPAYGMYLRHVVDATIENVKFSVKEKDIRENIVFEDVVNK